MVLRQSGNRVRLTIARGPLAFAPAAARTPDPEAAVRQESVQELESSQIPPGLVELDTSVSLRIQIPMNAYKLVPGCVLPSSNSIAFFKTDHLIAHRSLCDSKFVSQLCLIIHYFNLITSLPKPV